MDRDLLHPTLERERQSHKLKRLVPAPNSYFMDVKCGGCNETAVVFSHAQTIVACNNCKNILSKPTGGKCKLTEGSAFKVKAWFCPALFNLTYHSPAPFIALPSKIKTMSNWKPEIGCIGYIWGKGAVNRKQRSVKNTAEVSSNGG